MFGAPKRRLRGAPLTAPRILTTPQAPEGGGARRFSREIGAVMAPRAAGSPAVKDLSVDSHSGTTFSDAGNALIEGQGGGQKTALLTTGRLFRDHGSRIGTPKEQVRARRRSTFRPAARRWLGRAAALSMCASGSMPRGRWARWPGSTEAGVIHPWPTGCGRRDWGVQRSASVLSTVLRTQAQFGTAVSGEIFAERAPRGSRFEPCRGGTATCVAEMGAKR